MVVDCTSSTNLLNDWINTYSMTIESIFDDGNTGRWHIELDNMKNVEFDIFKFNSNEYWLRYFENHIMKFEMRILVNGDEATIVTLSDLKRFYRAEKYLRNYVKYAEFLHGLVKAKMIS